MLLRLHPEVAPGLTPRDINRWVRGLTQPAPLRQFTLVYELLTRMPNAGQPTATGDYIGKSGRRVPPAAGRWLALTAEMVTQLRREMRRTGLGVPDLLRFAAPAPIGLTKGVLLRVLYSAGQTINPAYWHYLLAQLAAAPTYQPVSPDPAGKPHAIKYNLPEHCPIAPADHQALVNLHRLTGVSGMKVLRGADDKPAGLDEHMIAAWLSGRTRSALPEHVAYVLARYRAVVAALGQQTE